MAGVLKTTDEATQAPAVSPISTAEAYAPPVGTLLDPKLFMAASRGDNNGLKELLGPDDDEVVIVDVDPVPAAPSSSSASGSSHHQLQQLDDHGVTSNEGDSLLHVVATRSGGGDGDRFVACANTIYYHGSSNGALLAARNHKGDTPLHCAARAGGARMVACLVALKTAEVVAAPAGDGPGVEEFLRMRNQCGETALHQAVRAACTACIDELLLVDPMLATVPQEGEGGASPFYLAFSLGKLDIARHLLDKTNGQLSTLDSTDKTCCMRLFLVVKVRENDTNTTLDRLIYDGSKCSSRMPSSLTDSSKGHNR